jgi:hypothetical protein
LDEQKALKILLVAGGRMFFLEEKQTLFPVFDFLRPGSARDQQMF